MDGRFPVVSSPVQQNPISFEDELESLFDFKACAEMFHGMNKTVVAHRVDHDGVDLQMQCNVDMDVEASSNKTSYR